eukprot:TRINITY_DN483_c0_g1_i2.p1 TRINITY_DN483_c0_g1~~TRINITY_DN483_c0_g1_i2.p1  ORF type:complete len:325 (-),score=94.51 TRINITY_DN483_c0_g1_i2:934-1908(-)
MKTTTLIVMLVVATIAAQALAEVESTVDPAVTRTEQVNTSKKCYLSVVRSARKVCNGLFWVRQDVLKARNLVWQEWHSVRSQTARVVNHVGGPSTRIEKEGGKSTVAVESSVRFLKRSRALFRLYKGLRVLYWRLFKEANKLGCLTCWKGANTKQSNGVDTVANEDSFDVNQKDRILDEIPGEYLDDKSVDDKKMLAVEEDHTWRTTAGEQQVPSDQQAEEQLMRKFHHYEHANAQQAHEKWYQPGCNCCMESVKSLMNNAPTSCKQYRSHKQGLYKLLARIGSLKSKYSEHRHLASELNTLVGNAKGQMKAWKGLLKCGCWEK